MNCTKRITLTGYTVRYADLREPKPRKLREEVYTMDWVLLGCCRGTEILKAAIDGTIYS